MKTRNKTITVKHTENLRKTGRECTNCEDGVFLQDGYEIICDTCQFTPTRVSRLREQTMWDRHREQVDARSSGSVSGRPRLVGGYEDAYWGEDEYEYHPSSGFHL